MDDIEPAYYYYVDPSVTYAAQAPNPIEDLISQYNLEDVSQQVARTNTDGTKAVKLRKSYKNQISDLSGRFTSIPTRENGKGGDVSQIVFQNNPDMMIQVNKKPDMSQEEWERMCRDRDVGLFQEPGMNWGMCNDVLSQFQRSYPAEFQNTAGFSIDDLAFDLDGTGKSNSKKRKLNKSSGSSMTTPNGNDADDLKKRRLE